MREHKAMNGKGPRVSLGTILVLCLTAAVVAGCVIVFAQIQGENPEARMGAQKVVGMIGNALHGPSPLPAPQNTVRTVTVTLAPTAAAATPAPTAYAQAEGTQPPARQGFSFTLTIGGLLGFHSDISDSVYDKTAKTFDYAPVLATLGSKVHADLNVATLPHVLNTVDQKYADVTAPAAILAGVKAGGFNDLLLNTEHILDQGAQGAADTAAAIMAGGFSCGGVAAGGAQQNRLVQINGGRVALLAYTDTLTNKGKNALESQAELLTLFDLESIGRDISAARSQGASFVAVFLHWGREEATAVTAAQRETARSLTAMGADLIVGTHPSRVLPMEIISCAGTDGSPRQALVAYSLGTLLTESREGYDISGALLHLRITCGSQGEVAFDSIEYTPTYIWRQSVGGKMQYRVVCSADAAPEDMDAKQREVMGRALVRVQNTLKDGPAAQRP